RSTARASSAVQCFVLTPALSRLNIPPACHGGRAYARAIKARSGGRSLRSEHPKDVGPPEVALGNTVALLRSLGSARLIALECEEDGDFLLGHVVRVGPRSADVHAVSSTGTWGERAVRVQLADLTRLQFGTHYNAMFERYASARHAPAGAVPRLRG
ncbi:MAG: hypothetical protein Q8K32_00815, partial [Archangium sp.]|nr:hypothetical protein [Archangium sp.]